MRDLHRQEQHIAKLQDRDAERGHFWWDPAHYYRIDLRMPKPPRSSQTPRPLPVGRELPQYYRHHHRYHVPAPVLAPDVEPLGEGSMPASADSI